MSSGTAKTVRMVAASMLAPSVPPSLYLTLMLAFSEYPRIHPQKFMESIPYYFQFSFLWSAIAAVPVILVAMAIPKIFANGLAVIVSYAFALVVVAALFFFANSPPVSLAGIFTLSLVASIGSLTETVPFVAIAGLRWLPQPASDS